MMSMNNKPSFIYNDFYHIYIQFISTACLCHYLYKNQATRYAWHIFGMKLNHPQKAFPYEKKRSNSIVYVYGPVDCARPTS